MSNEQPGTDHGMRMYSMHSAASQNNSAQSPNSFVGSGYRLLIRLGNSLQPVLLLAIRLYWGWQFFQTGKGKLSDLQKPTEFFQSLNIPFPHQQAILVGCIETICGLLLLVGLASRLASIPLIITLIVAYLTADIDAVKSILSDSDKFVNAAEFQFLLAALIVLAFGPGKLSLDHLLARKFSGSQHK